jgi:hypothetical protein
MLKRLLFLAVAIALAAVPGAAAQDLPDDPDPPSVDCSSKPKRTYSLSALLRNGGVRIPVRCDGATKVGLTFDVRAPLMATIHTPHQGVPDASGWTTFDAAGTKKVRMKLHPRTARAVKDFRWIRVGLSVVVEFPDNPGWYHGDPADRRNVFFRR